MEFSKEDYIRFLLNERIVRVYEEPIVLKSGRKTHYYTNFRPSSMALLNSQCDYAYEFIRKHIPYADLIVGVPEETTPHAILLQERIAEEKKKDPYYFHFPGFCMARGKPKKHGAVEDRFFIGEPKGDIVVVEDVITIGKSSLQLVHRLSQIKGVERVDVVAFTNRNELTPIPGIDKEEVTNSYKSLFKRVTGEEYYKPMRVEEVFEKIGIKLYSMSDASELLPILLSKCKMEVVKEVASYALKYGTPELQESIKRLV